MYEWDVVVNGVGSIGTVMEDNEELARCAAFSKFSQDGDRADKSKSIYEDDDISVFKIR
jgi:hypothetical protein